MRGRTLKQYTDQQKAVPEFKKAWDRLDPEFELLESLLKARERSGLTQAQLAQKIGTKQPALSRLERGGYRKATVETLHKIAGALDARLVVKLEKAKRH